ncbi:P-loop NTPase fold protein [Priestia megaterium]
MTDSEFLLVISDFFTKTITHSAYIFVISILFALLITIRVKKEWEMKGISIINFSFHILLVTLLAFSIKALNNKTSLSLLADYWKVALILFSLITIIFIKECISYSKTLDQVIQSYCRAIYLLLLSIFFTAITNNLNYTWDLIIIIFMFFTWGISNYEKTDDDKASNLHQKTTSEASDVPIKYFDHLFPTRKKEFLRIYDYLQNIDTIDPYAIAISANWGEGKTSLINALHERLKNENNEVIYLQPMILDTREKLLEYVFSQLETILINHKIYTGKGSPYKRYFELLMRFVNYKKVINFSDFFDVFPEDQKADLRELKNNLEKSIEKIATENQKIYIIVDDLDRVENETIYSTLTFIKEIVDLKRVTVLFLIDYKNIISEKITIEYLEKFINQKFDLSKINTNELFDYYLNDLIPVYNIKPLNNEVKNLRDNFNEYLNIIYGYIQDTIQRKEQIISDYKNKYEESYILNVKLEIKELNHQLNEVKSKISNARYVKKIISSIKETFDYLEKNIIEEKIIISVENQEIKVSELILKLSIFKIVFKEYHDELLRLGNIKSFLSDTNDEFIKSFFREQKNSVLFENEQIVRDIKYDFYNSIIFSDKLSNDIFNEIKSENKKLLDKIDLHTNSPKPLNFEELKRYSEAINYAYEEVDKDILNGRIQRFTHLVIASAKNKSIELYQIFELLADSHRNTLIHSLYFYEEVDKFLESSNVNFANKKGKDISLHYLKDVEYPLISKYKQSLWMFLKIYFLPEPNDKSLTDSLDSVTNLEKLNKKLIEILNIEINWQEKNSLKYFEKLFEIIDKKISLSIKKDDLTLKVYIDLKEDLEHFIKIYNLKTIISRKIDNIPLNKKAIFEITNDYLSTEEILIQLNNLYIHIIENKNEPNHQIYRFFHSLMNSIDRIINTEKVRINKDDFEKLTKIFLRLDKFIELNKGIYEKNYWYYCTIKLAELKRII